MRIEMDNNMIMVFTEYADKDKCKSILGGRWDKKRRCWVYPASPTVAEAMVRAWPGYDNSELSELSCRLTWANAAKREPVHLVDAPTGLKTDLWGHQKIGYEFIRRLGSGMLTMDMGTGKTLTALALHLYYGGSTLVLCPSGGGAVLEMWREQIHRHICEADETTYLILNKGSSKKKASELINKVYQLVVVNYESAWRDPLDDALLNYGFKLMIMDESAKIKSPGSKSSRFCAKLADRIPYRVALTGRPMPHSPLDIYGQMRAVDKGVFGTSFERFRQRYAIMGGYENHQVLGYNNQEEMARLLESVSYTVRSEDVQDLPEKNHIRIPVEMDPGCRKIYAALEKDWVAMVDDETISVQHCLTRLVRLQQITSGYIPDAEGNFHSTGAPNKCAAAMEIIDELAGEPVVVFCRFTNDILEVRKACQKEGIMTGELSGEHNDLQTWNAGAFQVLCVQIQSGSLAVDFTRARYAIYYSIGYSLGDFEQSEKRLHRPGQKQSVTYYHLVTQKSIDEKIYQMLTARKNVVDGIYTLMREV